MDALPVFLCQEPLSGSQKELPLTLDSGLLIAKRI